MAAVCTDWCALRLLPSSIGCRQNKPLLCPQELGVGILQNLHRQRETLTHARETLHGADDGLAKARRVLAGMSRRIMTNKLIMLGVCGLLLGSIILVVWYKIMH